MAAAPWLGRYFQVKLYFNCSFGTNFGDKLLSIGLSCACQKLERMYPKLYSNISRHTGPPPAEGNVGILLAVGHHILRSEPTWGKVRIDFDNFLQYILMLSRLLQSSA